MFGKDTDKVDDFDKLLQAEDTPVAEQPNHTHVWLPANNGREWVCGDCSERKSAILDVDKK